MERILVAYLETDGVAGTRACGKNGIQSKY